MTGLYLNKILSINAKHALYREDGYWYHNIKKFHVVLFDENGYLFFIDRESYLYNPGLQIKKDLHVVGGIESLPGYRELTYFERALIQGIDLNTIQKKEVDYTKFPRKVLISTIPWLQIRSNQTTLTTIT